MVRVEMLAVGRELLIGRTVNTNAQWLGARLARKGSRLAEITTIDDDLAEIASGLKGCLAREPDFLIVVGGLGPTPDDMTLKGVARGTGKRLRINGGALALIKEHYEGRNLSGIEMTPARTKMAILPTGAAPIRNASGTAPGVRLVIGPTAIFCLPGVPSEMKRIFRDSVEPLIFKRLGRLSRKYVRMTVEGIYESALAPLIAQELKLHPSAYIKSHPRGIREGKSRIELDVAVVKKDEKGAYKSISMIVGEIKRGIKAEGGKVVSETGPDEQRKS